MRREDKQFSPPPRQTEQHLTADEVHERIAYLKRLAREGADKVHTAGTPLERRHKPTPAEDLAQARARADRNQP